MAPDDEDVQKFWKFTRGTPEDPSQRRPAHWVRAVFEVPESYGYNVSAIKDLNGHKINWGSQLADAIQIKLIGQAAEIGRHLGQKRRCKPPQPPPVATVTTMKVAGMSATAEVGEDYTPADLKGTRSHGLDIEAQGYNREASRVFRSFFCCLGAWGFSRAEGRECIFQKATPKPPDPIRMTSCNMKFLAMVTVLFMISVFLL